MSAESRTTRTFRLSEDLAEMAVAILEVEGLRSAEFFDPIVRDEIERRYALNSDAIKALRRARQRRQKVEEVELGEAGA